MKKRLLSVAFLMGAMAANAQVGIGTATPNKSAELLIESSNRGLLIPNVALTSTTDKTTITNGNVKSLLVFATTAQKDIKPGYHYWDGAKWARLTADHEIPQNVADQFSTILKIDGDKVANLIKGLFSETTTNVDRQKAGKYIYTNEKGEVQPIDVVGDLTEILNGGVYPAFDTVLKQFIDKAETVTSLLYNGTTRTLSYKDEDNKDNNIDIAQILKDHTTNSLTVNGNELVSTVNGVEGKTDLTNKISNGMLQGESVTNDKLSAGKGDDNRVAVADKDGKVTYKTQKEIVEGNTSNELALDGNKLTSTVNGKTSSVVLTENSVDSSKGITGTGIVVDGGANATLKDVKLSIADGAITPEKMAKGDAGSVLVTDKDGKVKWVKEDAAIIKDMVKANETITTLKDNGNGTFTYYNESDYGKDGQLKPGVTGTPFDANTLNVTSTNGVYTFKDKSGKELAKIDTNAKASGYDNGTSGLTSKDVQGAIDELVSKINTVAATKGTLSSTDIVVSDGTNAILKDVTLSIATGAITSDKIKEGAVTTEKIAAGKDNQVLVTVTENGKEVTKWVDKKEVTTNEFTSAGNTMTSNVNGVSKTADIVNSIGNSLDKDNKLVTTVNGKAGEGIDLTPAIQAGQKTTSVEKGSDKVTVVETTTGKNTEYVVDVVEAKLNLGNMGGQVTTTQITDGAVTTEKIAAGTEGQVLVTVTEGGKEVTKWVDKKEATSNKLETKGDKIISTVNGKEAELKLEGDVILKDGKTEVSKLQGNDLATANVAEGEVLSFEGGKWVNKVPTVNTDNVTNGKALTSTEQTIAITGTGATALLKDVQIDVANGAITSDKLAKDAVTSDKIKDGAVSTGKIEAGTAGQVLVTVTENGKEVTKWVPANDLGNTVTAGNGLTKTGNEIKLGGELTEKTTLTTAPGKELAIKGLEDVKTNPSTNNIVLTDPATGELKQTSAKNLLEDTIAKGGSADELQAKTLKGEGITVTAGATVGTSLEVANALLKDVILGIADGAITEGKIKDGAVTTDKIGAGAVTEDKIAAGAEGQVLVTKGGETKWVDKTPTTNEFTLGADNKLVSNVNGVSKEVDLTSKVTEGMLNGGKGTDGRIAVTDKDGKITYQEVSGKALNGKALTSGSIKVFGGSQALLDGTVIEVQGGAKDGQVLVTKTKEIVVGKDANGADIKETHQVTEWVDQLPAEKLVPGTDGQVLVTEGGVTKWVDKTPTTNDLKIVDGKLISTVNGQPATLNLTNEVTKEMLQTGSVTKEKIAEDVAGNGLGKNADGSLEVKAGNGIAIVDDKVTVNAGTGLSFGTDGKLNVDFPTATTDKAGVVKPDKGLDIATDGTLTVNYETAKTELAKGKVESTTIIVNDGLTSEGSTFKDVKLEIKAGDKDGQILVTEGGVTKWAEPKETVLAGDVTGKAGETVVNGIQGTPVSETKPSTEGQALVFNTTTNTWEPGTPAINADQVKNAADLTTDGIIVVEGANPTEAKGSLLAAAKLSIKEGGISSKEIKDGTIKPEDIALTESPNQVLITGTDKKPTWVDQSTLAIEPWNVQGSTNQAKNNTDNIYQQGKVAIGFTKDDVATKTLDVRGDFSTVSESNGNYSGIITNVNAQDANAIGNLLFTSKELVKSMSDLMSVNEVGGLYTVNRGFAAIGKKGEAKSSLSVSAIDEKAFDVTLGGSVIKDGKQTSANLWGNNDNMLLGHIKDNESVKVSLRGTEGVTFRHENEGYTFPKTKGGNNQVLVSDGGKSDSGNKISKLEWKSALEILVPGNNNQVLTTVDNGGTKTVVWTDKDKPTTVTGSKTETGDVVVSPGTNPNEYVVDVKSAMPKVFYMPPVVFDTSDRKGGAVQTRDLHAEYLAQFVNVKSNLRSGDAPVSIPNTATATDLHYYVTYHDSSVIEITGISNDGKLSYKVIGDSTPATFMTIVFVVK